jgi:hypothetical protein
MKQRRTAERGKDKFGRKLKLKNSGWKFTEWIYSNIYAENERQKEGLIAHI